MNIHITANINEILALVLPLTISAAIICGVEKILEYKKGNK